MRQRLPYDDVAWEESERLEHEWSRQMTRQPTLIEIGNFITKHARGVPIELCDPAAGSYNGIFRMKFIGSSAIIRLPKCGCTAMFPEESVRNEAAVLRYIQENTAIPVPFLHHWGTRKDCPVDIGPCFIMEYITHEEDMGIALNIPGRGKDQRLMLNPDIDPDKLKMIYGELGNVLLELSCAEFPAIGSLAQTDDGTWRVRHRPLTMHMNELVRLGSMPRSRLLGPDATFNTSSDYYQHLANQHLEHLRQQRNDIIDDETDCRRKFIARKLFQKLARDDKLASISYRTGPFKLWCDDLRPMNVLTNGGGQVAAVLDWEFTYVAPAEFTFAPPWWLLLEQPEYWPNGLDDWTNAFDAKLEVFLQALRQREDSAIADGRLTEEQRLSGKMRASWDGGDFWIVYAARKGFAFDLTYWHKIDQRFFGPLNVAPEDAWRERLHMLDEDEVREMEELVVSKMKEMETRELKWEPAEVWPLDGREKAETATDRHDDA
ncbi:hypothetical protein MY4824_010033 [Beauveria thailandica]